MNSHISEEDWAIYAGGAPDEALNRRIHAHLETCAECTEWSARLAAWPDRLAEEGLRLRSALAVSDSEVERMLAIAMEKIGAPQRRTAGFAEGIAILRGLLEPVIGAGITRAAVEKALLDSETRNNWREFVSRLSATIQSVCGSAAGNLAGRAGMAIGV